MNRLRTKETGQEARGLTLVEVTVSSVILLAMFYGIYLLLAPGLRVWMESDRKVTLQQNALIAMTRLVNELRDSNSVSISKRDYGGAGGVFTLICFASARKDNGSFAFKEELFSGTPIPTADLSWQRFVIYYLDQHSRLRRYETAQGSYDSLRDPEGLRLAGDPSSLIQVSDLVSNEVVGRKIRTLSIMYNPCEASWRGFDITVTAYDENDRVREFSTTLQTTVEVRYEDSAVPNPTPTP